MKILVKKPSTIRDILKKELFADGDLVHEMAGVGSNPCHLEFSGASQPAHRWQGFDPSPCHIEFLECRTFRTLFHSASSCWVSVSTRVFLGKWETPKDGVSSSSPTWLQACFSIHAPLTSDADRGGWPSSFAPLAACSSPSLLSLGHGRSPSAVSEGRVYFLNLGGSIESQWSSVSSSLG